MRRRRGESRRGQVAQLGRGRQCRLQPQTCRRVHQRVAIQVAFGAMHARMEREDPLELVQRGAWDRGQADFADGDAIRLGSRDEAAQGSGRGRVGRRARAVHQASRLVDVEPTGGVIHLHRVAVRFEVDSSTLDQAGLVVGGRSSDEGRHTPTAMQAEAERAALRHGRSRKSVTSRAKWAGWSTCAVWPALSMTSSVALGKSRRMRSAMPR